MANLSIRNLDNQIYALLQVRSVEHHISMEEEVRRIITEAVTPHSIADLFEAHFGEKNGIDLDELLNYNPPHHPIDFKS